MANDGDDGDVDDGDHGAVSDAPATNPTAANADPMDEKIKNDFNFMEFFQLAMRVLDDGDSESMAALLDLKRRWMEKFGGDAPLGGAGVDHADSVPYDPRPAPIVTRPARRFPRLPNSEQAALILQVALPATTITAMDGLITPILNHGPLAPHPSPLAAPSSIELKVSEPPPSGSKVLSPRPTTPSTATAVIGLALPTIVTAPAKLPTPEILIGNVPLKPYSDFKLADDKIAATFHNSSRKTLNYIPPSVQNGEVLVRPTIDMIPEGSNRWNTTAVGYFLGKKPYFHYLNEFWRMEEVIERGPWLFHGQPIVLQKWELGMVLRKLKHTEVPVWIKLRHLPMELWTMDGLSTVASGIGRALPDAITQACTRLDFARVCVMLNVSSKLPKHIVIMMPNEHRGESACKPAVSIYVRKNVVPTPAPESMKGDQVSAAPDRDGVHPVAEVDMVSEELSAHRRDKGKQIVLYNAFDILRGTDDDAEGSIRGPTHAAPRMFPHVEYSDMECSGPE
ncbi:UNVERIFIED_CONTAM: hypothetical protein Scaly_1930000 [Sesamum calycinum]|uniref:DUF4283 domain-containing protein n=1 Tax=Sesamum calycinum TaxID=2727403 RepID=A0AAW2NGL5_9LAMI